MRWFFLLLDAAPQAGLTARDGSVICTDEISGCTIEGDMDFSVSAKQVRMCNILPNAVTYLFCLDVSVTLFSSQAK